MKRICWASNKEVLLCVTGSIAAYKACDVASRLVKTGAQVTVAMTRAARQLVGPATFEALTGHPCITDMFSPLQNAEVDHIAVAQRVAAVVVAPATANMLGKAAHGIADDWISTSLLATRAPVLFAPAMNTLMWEHPAVQDNVRILRERGCHFAGPGAGRLACGAEGAGRMAEPASVVEAILALIEPRKDLAGKSVLITSGGTHEPMDPVRYIGNRSTGRMGYAVALAALARGANVTVVTGPAEVAPPCGCNVIRIETARQMADEVATLSPTADAIIGVAAVADYRIAKPATEKRKRVGSPLTLDLVENPDIIAGVGRNKRPGQVVVGFAAETSAPAVEAARKCADKNLDLVIGNLVGVADSGFGAETSRAWFVYPDGTVEEKALQDKTELAADLMDRVVAMLKRDLRS